MIRTKDLVKIYLHYNLSELEYRDNNGQKIVLRNRFVTDDDTSLNTGPDNSKSETCISDQKSQPDEPLHHIISDSVGTFVYENGIQSGAMINNGQTLGHIRALGEATPVISESDGRIVELSVKDGEIADFGKVLLKVQEAFTNSGIHT